ncbi:MAG TPA: hypothetical protein VM432_02365 [Bdellovibrionales bacterium]|nr:hypothetical protein [Bdellovibrionales bacterium]
MANAWIAGSTGLVGGALANALARKAQHGQVNLLVRKNTAGSPLAILRQVPVDFERLDFDAQTGDDYFCALGTTIKKAGSQEAFRLVDETYVVRFAEIAKRQNARVLVIVSAVGADPLSPIFYNRVKGEMESKIRALGLRSVYVLHPSLLLGHRNEFRLGEKIAELAAPVLSPLLFGSFAKYRPVQADRVAVVAIECAAKAEPGFHIVEPVR